jgi:hypothetical protein
MIGRNPEFVAFGPFRFVPGDGLWHHGQPVALPSRALAVLTALLATPGTVVLKQNLMNAAWPVSSSGGAWPSWSNDGAIIYFTAGADTMASGIRTESGLTAAVATVVRPGGSRGHARADLRIVLDWFSELASHVRPS